jgi:protein-L-isoaspartate O-methyltransferase
MATDFAKERERMVEGLIREGLLKSPNVIAAIKKVPRELFVPEHLRSYAYTDVPLPTEHGQTISAPHGIECRALHGRHNESSSRTKGWPTDS